MKLDNTLLRQNEKENKLKILNKEYQDIKEEYKNTHQIIKKQINSIIILEDNCQFIGENIAYHKNNMENNYENEENIDFEEIKKKADEVKNLKEILENKYVSKIRKQNEKIKKLKEFNGILAETILEKSKEIKLDEINRNKSIRYLSDKSIGFKENNIDLENEEHFKDENSAEEKDNLINKTTKELNIKNN